MTDRADPPPFAPFVKEDERELYASHWCRLRLDRVDLGDGDRLDYHVFEIPDAVTVVPVLPDGSIVMLWQYRYPHGRTHWEVPAGRVDDGETPEEAALRELAEETGYRAGALTHVCGFYPINGISPHHAHVFLATDCVRESDPRPDASERIRVEVMPEAQVRERLLAGDFADGFTSLALFHHFARRDAR